MSSCRPPLRVLLLFLVPLAGLPLLASCFFFFCGVLLRIRGFCDLEFENSAQQQPVCCLVFFFLYSESISGLDALHTVHNSGFVHTLPKEQASSVQQILFRGVMTPTLLPVRPGLHLTDVGLLGVCHCHCHCQHALVGT